MVNNRAGQEPMWWRAFLATTSEKRTLSAMPMSGSLISTSSMFLEPPTKHLIRTESSGARPENLTEVHVAAIIFLFSVLGTTKPKPLRGGLISFFFKPMETLGVETYGMG